MSDNWNTFNHYIELKINEKNTKKWSSDFREIVRCHVGSPQQRKGTLIRTDPTHW